MSRADALIVLRGLSSQQFDQSISYDEDPARWYDVYKPVWKGTELYVKFCRYDGSFLLCSFHESF
jgi:hypothetical protein